MILTAILSRSWAIMVEKVPVPCPNCGVRVRMPTKLRPGKKPRCPKCKIIIRPADVLPPELLAPLEKPVDQFAETKTRLPDLYAETKTQIWPPPSVRANDADLFAETIERQPMVSPLDSMPYPPPLEDTVMGIPSELPPIPLEDTALPSGIIRALEANKDQPPEHSQ